MKYNNMYKVFSVAAVAMMLFTSCNDFLDKLPDDRAELTTEENIKSLVTDAYPSSNTILMMELSSDNISDNGRQYGTSELMEQLYKWEDVETDGNDSPRSVWNGMYSSVATANQVLEAAEEMGFPESIAASVAEARIVRAFSMFKLAQAFCMAWNPEKADEYLGLPYPLYPEQDINTHYERGTLRELYAAINADIEAALPDIDDAIYSVPKYHFNRKAAYAFAARFNLFYMNYDKAIEYASEVLGNDPKSVMRDFVPYIELGREDMGNRWIQSSESGNIMLHASYSATGYYLAWGGSSRFNHNYDMTAYETYWPEGPWGSGSSVNTLYYAHNLYGSSQCVAFPSCEAQFEFVDKLNNTGYYHVVEPEFTGDETILVRAEAYAMLKQYDKCVADLNTWIETHCYEEYVDTETEAVTARPVLTVNNLNVFWDSLPVAESAPASNRDRSIRKKFNPQGFSIEPGHDETDEDGDVIHIGSTQENLLQMVLHMRRLDGVFHGSRFYDIKRYGIEFSHNVSGQEPIIFKAGDLRGAIQLPIDVIQAGLPRNPREPKEK